MVKRKVRVSLSFEIPGPADADREEFLCFLASDMFGVVEVLEDQVREMIHPDAWVEMQIEDA